MKKMIGMNKHIPFLIEYYHQTCRYVPETEEEFALVELDLDYDYYAVINGSEYVRRRVALNFPHALRIIYVS